MKIVGLTIDRGDGVTDFKYKPQVQLDRVVEYGDGWLNKDEKPLISVDDLLKINDVISSGRKCEFREGHDPYTKEAVDHTHYWLRWFHVPESYLITLDVLDDFAKFMQVKDQLNRYIKCLTTTVYPLYRREEHIDWNNE